MAIKPRDTPIAIVVGFSLPLSVKSTLKYQNIAMTRLHGLPYIVSSNIRCIQFLP